MNSNDLSRTLAVVTWAMWTPALALAATLNYDAGLADVGLLAAAVNGAIALLSGLTALLQSIRRELMLSGTGRLPNPAVFCAANLLGSLLAGVLGFGLSRWGAHTSIWLEMVTVGAFAFVGARLVETLAERLLGHYLPGAGRLRPVDDDLAPRRARIDSTSATENPKPDNPDA